MSKHNKVNPDHYHQAGRLTPDEMARERMKQQPLAREHKHDKAGQYRESTPGSAPAGSVSEEDADRG